MGVVGVNEREVMAGLDSLDCTRSLFLCGSFRQSHPPVGGSINTTPKDEKTSTFFLISSWISIDFFTTTSCLIHRLELSAAATTKRP